MRKSALLLLVLVLSVKIVSAQGPDDKARFAAEQWIVLVDDGQYDESWKEAAKIFQDSNPQSDWQKKAQTERTQIGQKTSRRLKDLKSAGSVKGLPAGQYYLVRYQSSFTNKKTALETITTVLEADGTWRVAAYSMN